MSIAMREDQLADRVAKELSSPEPTWHFGVTLLVGTLVASPVLSAAVMGRWAVPTALAIYAATLVVTWLSVGLVAGAFALVGPTPTDRLGATDDPDGDDSGLAGGSTPAPGESVGSNSAH